MSPNESYPQHVVTAVIVAHDGAVWLPRVADALLGQTRPVQRIVAVDTGSRDRSGAVLASKFGQAVVFGMDRSTGYGAAIARALAHRAANAPVPGSATGPSGDRVEWLWLLHDDCEPAPDALEQLLRGAAETSAAAVLGPKLRDWTNHEVILEAGVTLDTATRRVTGIEPREVDQGQHDGDRDTLAVSSAGMLVRRDVWEQVGGFDAGMALFMEDIDFCWRVHSAGYRVRVITDAIAYHVQAATKHRRAVSVGRRARMLDRRNGLLTLLGNLPFRHMLTSAAGNVVVSLLRITFFLLAKRLTAAMDEATAVVAVLCHPIRLISMRRKRARGRRAAYSRVRADLPAGRSARRLAEFAMSTMTKSQADTTGAHHASVDPAEDDSLLVDNGLARRLLTSPSLLTFVALLAIALVAARSLIGSGPLGGGSLVPAWGGASDLWHIYVQAFHPAGIGSTAQAPPWLAVVAGLATILAGKPWLAIDVILIGCVPLAGMTAMLAVRRVTKSVPVRVWASATYALLPVGMGVVATGRFGSAVAFVLMPLIVLLGGRIFTGARQQASRAAWATGLLVAIAAAFVPLLWLVAVTACVLAAIVFRNTRAGLLRNLAIVALTAPVLLMPWPLTLASHPVDLLLEAGLPQPGTPVTGLPARALMLLSPGGPGLPPYWVTAGLVAVALAALFAGRRRRLITAGWGLALSGLLTAIVVSHLTVNPGDGGPVVVWAGLPLAIAALGLLLAGSVGADAIDRLMAGRKGWHAIVSGRGLWAALLAVVACSAPALAAASWLGTGVSGPVHPVASQLVPELVAVADGQSHQVRTLVLRESAGHVSYLLLRGPSPSLADSALTPPADAQLALSKVVAALTTPDGGLAVNQAQLLADFDIGYVLVQAPVDKQLAGLLNNVSGLRPYSITSSYVLWQLATPPARVVVVEPNGTVVPIASGSVGVSAAKVPAIGGTLMLAEPAGGWSATVDGRLLPQVPSPAGPWAQAFRLPGGGGTLNLGQAGFVHDLALIVELLVFLAIAGLALPGIRVADQDGQHAGAAGGTERAADDARGTGSHGIGSPRIGSHGIGSQRIGSHSAAADVADDADDGEADGGIAPRVGVAGAAARAGSARPLRGRGAGKAGRSGRGRLAARDKKSRNKAGRGTVGRGASGRPAPGEGRAGQAALGLDGSDTRSPDLAAGGARTGRHGGAAGERDSWLAAAWPYDASDSQRGELGQAGAWPYDTGDDPRRGPSGGGQGRAWPYGTDDGSSTRASGEHRAPGRAGWPTHDAEAEPGGDRRSPAGGDRRSPAGGSRSIESGRSPSGRSPSGAWPYSDLDAQPDLDRGPSVAGRSPSGRPPASSRPYSGEGGDYGVADERPGPPSAPWPSADEAARGRGWADSGRPSQESALEPRDREVDAQKRGRWGRPARSGGTDRPDGSDQLGDVWAGADRPGGDRGAGDRGAGDRGAGHRGASHRGAGGRPGGGRGGGGRGGSDRPGGGRGGGDRDAGDRPGGGRGGGDRGGSEQPGGGRGGGDRDGAWAGADRAGGDRAAGQDRWGRRGRDERSTGPAGGQAEGRRVAEGSAAWTSGDGDELEPLPPIDGPSRSRGRRSAWRPAEDDSGDWGRPTDSQISGDRWSAPVPEYEPGYEGEGW